MFFHKKKNYLLSCYFRLGFGFNSFCEVVHKHKKEIALSLASWKGLSMSIPHVQNDQGEVMWWSHYRLACKRFPYLYQVIQLLHT